MRLRVQKRHKVAQVLLTHDDLEHHERHLNARNTLLTLLQRGVVPIINLEWTQKLHRDRKARGASARIGSSMMSAPARAERMKPMMACCLFMRTSCRRRGPNL